MRMILAISILAGTAAAQPLTFDGRWPQTPTTPRERGELALAGPEVVDRSVVGLGGMMGGEEMAYRNITAEGARLALGRLAGGETPPTVRIDTARRDDLLAEIDRTAADRSAYDEKHAARMLELQTMLARARDAVNRGGKASTPADVLADGQAELDRLVGERPGVADAWKRVLAEMSAIEQRFAERYMAEAEAMQDRRRALEEVRQQRAVRIGLLEEAASEADDMGFRVEELPEAVRSRLDRLPHERREVAISRLRLAHIEKMNAREEPDGFVPDAPPPPPERQMRQMDDRVLRAAPTASQKPPPSMDEVPLPILPPPDER
ncbi:MAG: hypothetical protein AAGI17_07030 [Planctomycetota bacterium]